MGDFNSNFTATILWQMKIVESLTSTTHDESPLGKNRTAPLPCEKQKQDFDHL